MAGVASIGQSRDQLYDQLKQIAAQLEKLDAQQKAWAEEISPPPRNAKHTNPPYRAYIRSPELAKRLSSLSDYLRWKTSLPPRLSELLRDLLHFLGELAQRLDRAAREQVVVHTLAGQRRVARQQRFKNHPVFLQ